MPDRIDDPCNVARQDLMQHPPEEDLPTEIRSVLFRAEMDNSLPPELGRVAKRLDELLAREVARNKGVLGSSAPRGARAGLADGGSAANSGGRVVRASGVSQAWAGARRWIGLSGTIRQYREAPRPVQDSCCGAAHRNRR